MIQINTINMLMALLDSEVFMLESGSLLMHKFPAAAIKEKWTENRNFVKYHKFLSMNWELFQIFL